MKLVVLPALIPDIERIYDIYFAAFKNEQMAQLMLEILFPSGITEEFRKGHTANTLAFWHMSTYQYTLKCVDADSGEIVGMLLADLHLKGRSEEERKNFGVPWLEGAQRERAEKVLNPLWEIKERVWGGRPHIYVHVIAVSPEHQGKFAGVTLIKWGIDVAEKTGLPIYCESSPTTYKLYQKFGFHTLKDEKLIHSKDVLGTPEDIEVPLMVRMPAVAGDSSFESWRDAGFPSWDKAQIAPLVLPTRATEIRSTAPQVEVIEVAAPKVTAIQVTGNKDATMEGTDTKEEEAKPKPNDVELQAAAIELVEAEEPEIKAAKPEVTTEVAAPQVLQTAEATIQVPEITAAEPEVAAIQISDTNNTQPQVLDTKEVEAAREAVTEVAEIKAAEPVVVPEVAAIQFVEAKLEEIKEVIIQSPVIKELQEIKEVVSQVAVNELLVHQVAA